MTETMTTDTAPAFAPGLTTADLVSALQRDGYTGVITMGGALPLARWEPYGMATTHAPAGVNGPHTCRHCGAERLRWRRVAPDLATDGASCCEVDQAERDRMTRHGFVNGAWTFTRDPFCACGGVLNAIPESETTARACNRCEHVTPAAPTMTIAARTAK